MPDIARMTRATTCYRRHQMFRACLLSLVLIAACGTVEQQDPDAAPTPTTPDAAPPGGAQLATGSPSQNFGNLAVGRQSAPAVIAVTNTGTEASGTLAVEVVGGGAHFDVTDGCAGTALAAGEQCSVQVVFAPEAAGSHSATLRVRATPGGEASTTLTGTALAAGALVASVEQLVFGSVDLGAPVDAQPIEIRNAGAEATAPLAVMLGDGTSFEIVTDGCTGQVLAADGRCSIAVAFSPDTVGTKSSSVTVSGGSVGSVPVPLGGVATARVTVTVAGTIGGAVRSMPAGIDCGPQCAASFSASSVRLEATATNGAAFSGWNAACQGTNAICNLPVDGAKAVGARFTYGLRTTVSNAVTGRGGRIISRPISLDCSASCDTRVTAGDAVELEAQPDTGQVFVEWRGACTGRGACRPPTTADATVEAVFSPDYELRVGTTYASCGPVTSVPAGIDCSNGRQSCSARFVHGTRITLTTPFVSGFCGSPVFQNVTCAASDPEGTCTFTLTRSLSINVDYFRD